MDAIGNNFHCELYYYASHRAIWVVRTFFLMLFSSATIQGGFRALKFDSSSFFPSFRQNQSRRSHAFHWLLKKRKAQPNGRKLTKRSRKKTVQVGTSSPSPRNMSSSLMAWCYVTGTQACCCGPQRAFSLRCIRMWSKFIHLNCPINTVATCVRFR